MATDMQVCFCDPQSQQRGSNENTNGLLRDAAKERRPVQVLAIGAGRDVCDSIPGTTTNLGISNSGRMTAGQCCVDPLRPPGFPECGVASYEGHRQPQKRERGQPDQGASAWVDVSPSSTFTVKAGRWVIAWPGCFCSGSGISAEPISSATREQGHQLSCLRHNRYSVDESIRAGVTVEVVRLSNRKRNPKIFVQWPKRGIRNCCSQTNADQCFERK